MFADVIVDIQHEKLDKIFQYRIPESMEGKLEPGMEVLVPFGKGNRKVRGYVTGISETCDYDLSKVKEIIEIPERAMEIEAKLVALAAWMKENYGGTMIQALKTVLPIKQKEKAKVKNGFSFMPERYFCIRQIFGLRQIRGGGAGWRRKGGTRSCGRKSARLCASSTVLWTGRCAPRTDNLPAAAG